MSWGANADAQVEQTDRKGSNFLVTLGIPEYEAFVQNMFKLVRWASGVLRRQRFVNRICPCDTDEMSVEDRWDYRKLLVPSGINLEIAIKLGQYKKLLVVSILKSLVNSGTVENYYWYQS
jgi:hypothetical protein